MKQYFLTKNIFKDNVKVNAPSKKRKRESCDSPTPNSQPKNKKPKLLVAAEKMIEAIPMKILEDNRRKLKSGFKLFQLANKDECIKKHGECRLKKIIDLGFQISNPVL